MPGPLPNPLRDLGRSRINRAPSPLVAATTPWLLVMLASLGPIWPIVASAPLLPPLGFMVLIAWQQLRPGLFPVWAGLPLGLFDDLYSGQPLGSAVVLWSLTMIGLDLLELAIPWRTFLHNWLVAAGVIVVFLIVSLVFANLAGGRSELRVILPQIVLSVLLYPIVARLVALVDRLRLLPIRAV